MTTDHNNLRVRTVIYDARDFAALTVTLLPPEAWEALWVRGGYRINVIEPQDIPRLPVDLGLTMQLHHVDLRGVRVQLGPQRSILLVVTDTPKLALWLPPVQLPGQDRTDEDIARESFEAGLRDGARLKALGG